MRSGCVVLVAVVLLIGGIAAVVDAVSGGSGHQGSSTSTATPPPPATTTAVAGPALCGELLRQGRQGKCVAPNGLHLVVANQGSRLRLRTLVARVVGTRTVRSFSAAGGSISAVAQGRYLVVSLKVANRTDSPQDFDAVGSNQLELLIGQRSYTEAFDAENQADQQSFVSQNSNAIQPGESRTGDVIFDVPSRPLRRLASDVSGVVVANFGAGSNPQSAGLLRVTSAGG